ncbi:MAG: helix-turn-helix domain-containing protein [Clostridia bacterium]
MKRNKLAAIIVENGLTQKKVAEKLNMSPKTFYNKMKKGVFGTNEVQSMVDFLHIVDPIDIFLLNE